MNNFPETRLASICNCILEESSSPRALHDALDAFAQMCGDISDIHPDPSFDAWADDALLATGVAINPQAAAHCVSDYRRSVAFIRGVYAAINTLRSRFPGSPLDILYAGCGPFATLLLPLLGKINAGELNVTLLDIHQRSLDSVDLLLREFGLSTPAIRAIRGDACHYRHDKKLHLVIAETMQKSLEQEPQFAVTANLAPQLSADGLFIPQQIEVELSLTDLEYEKKLVGQSREIDPGVREKRHPLATVFTLSPEGAVNQLHKGRYNALTKNLELNPTTVTIPSLANNARLDAVLFTRITVFEQYRLEDYECEITLPLQCHELAPLAGGEQYRVAYQLGSYPKFTFARLHSK